MRRELSLGSAAERRRAANMLQSLLIADLLGPSGPLFVALERWGDVPVVDNTQGGFSTLCPDWPRGPVALSSVLVQFLRRGRPVHLVVRPGIAPRFVGRLVRDVERLGLDGLLVRQGSVAGGSICSTAFLAEGALEALLAGTAEGLVRFDTDAAAASVRCRELGEAT
jgi:hypothetical protein